MSMPSLLEQYCTRLRYCVRGEIWLRKDDVEERGAYVKALKLARDTSRCQILLVEFSEVGALH